MRCAPPDNRPTLQERDRCLPYLASELSRLGHVRVFVALGGFAFTNVVRMLRAAGDTPAGTPRFGHGAEVALASGRTLLGCYHPSQQNTFTGRLTAPMLAAVFARARRLLLG